MLHLSKVFNEYASYHRSTVNQLTHYVGIPLIAIALLGLLGRLWIHWPMDALGQSGLIRLDGGILLWAVAMLFYVVLDWRLTVPFSLFTLGLYFAGRALSVPTLWILFVLGWAFQGIGHYVYEKKSPAFLKNFEHLLIGPFWLFAKTVGYVASEGSAPPKPAKE